MYILEIQQLKNSALAMKNLELAVAVNEELKMAGVETPSTPTATTAAGATAAGTILSAFLPRSFWTPERADTNTIYKSIEFTAEGEIILTPKWEQGKFAENTKSPTMAPPSTLRGLLESNHSILRAIIELLL